MPIDQLSVGQKVGVRSGNRRFDQKSFDQKARCKLKGFTDGKLVKN